MHEAEKLAQAIASLEAQRAILGDEVVDAGIVALREKINSLQALQAAPPLQQRKQVTVLFADIAGFTRLAEKADAEDVGEFTNLVWQVIDGIIMSFGGKIDKHMGDAVMAIWGSESAQEDDPVRAIQAGLEIQRHISYQQLSQDQTGSPALAEFIQRLPPDLLHIGIHSGPVFLGTVGSTREFTALGDTVNTASRIQNLAQPGQVVISHDTYVLVRGLFSVEAMQPVNVRGKTEALQTYVVKAAKPRLFRPATRGVEGIDTGMVGRDSDLQCLQDMLQATIQQHTCRLVTVIGEAGLGKSRLVYEFENWAELLPTTIHYFRGRASQEIQNQPYALLRDVFFNRFSIQENEAPADVRAKFERGIAEWAGQNQESQMRAHVIGQLLGFDFRDSPYLAEFSDRQQLHSRALLYLKEYLQAITQARPTVLLLDDIHWADSSTLDAVETLAAELAPCALMMICLTRPVLFEQRTQWLQHLPYAKRLHLKPLSPVESRDLTSQFLRHADNIPAALYDMVTSGSEGNPYYIEEFIKMLIDDGVIITGDEPWKIEIERLNQVHIPTNLTGVIQSRLDSLPAFERRVIQQASVIGRVFWDDTIVQMNAGDTPGAAPHLVSQTLEALHQRELIFELRSSTFQGAREYIFKHALLRQVTYENVLKRDRRQYHAQIAAWLVHHSREHVSEFAGLIGSHLDMAGEAATAAGYLRQAGEWAMQQFDNLHALAFFERALTLITLAASEERLAILRGREQVNDAIGKREAQFDDLQAMEALLSELSLQPQVLTRLQAEVKIRFSNYYEVTCNYAAAIVAAQQAVAFAEQAADIRQQCAGYYRLGRALWRQGNNTGGRKATERALKLAGECDWKQLQAHCLRQIGAIAFHQGDYVHVMPSYVEALAIYQRIGDRSGAGSTLNNMGDNQRQFGLYLQAREAFNQALEISRSVGERWTESITLFNLSQICIALGEYEDALQFAHQAIELARAIAQGSTIVFGWFNRGRALTGLGRLEEAAAAYQQAIDANAQTGRSHVGIEILAWLAYTYLLQGQTVQAHQAAATVQAYLEVNTLDGVEEPFADYLLCYRVLKATQDERAGQVIESAYNLLQQQAARITDAAMRSSFLCNVQAHAEIIQVWESGQAA